MVLFLGLGTFLSYICRSVPIQMVYGTIQKYGIFLFLSGTLPWSYSHLGSTYVCFLNSVSLGATWVLPFCVAAYKHLPGIMVMFSIFVSLLTRLAVVHCLFFSVWKPLSDFQSLRWEGKSNQLLQRGLNRSLVENYWNHFPEVIFFKQRDM